MIYAYKIYDTLVSICRKDKRGLSLSIDDFNNLAFQVNERLFKFNYADFEQTKLSMAEMDSFKIVKWPINLDSNGIGTLPDDFYLVVGDPYYYLSTAINEHPIGERRKVELVTSLEFGNREMDYDSRSTSLYPLAFLGYATTSGDMGLYCNPVADMASKTIYLDYIRRLATPFLDYYVNDTTFEVTYMAQGATVTVPLGSTSRSGLAGSVAVVSQTQNFEFHPHDVPQLINLFLGLIGLQLSSQDLQQASMAYENIIEKE